jgi:HTH-type transcriptional regulator / antitoxin HipB
MGDLQRYVQARRAQDVEFADGLETGYTNFKIGVLLRQAREAAGLTQAEVAQRLQTPPTTISQMENHAEEVRLSLLKRYAEILGKQLHTSLA